MRRWLASALLAGCLVIAAGCKNSSETGKGTGTPAPVGPPGRVSTPAPPPPPPPPG